jgi:hypothetical protein
MASWGIKVQWEIFLCSLAARQLWCQWVEEVFFFFCGVEAARADYSCPSDAEVRSSWSCASISSFVFRVSYLIKHKKHFILHPYF